MATITYNFDVNAVVYYVSDGSQNAEGVHESVVREVNIAIDNVGTTIEYHIVPTQQPASAMTVAEADVYADVDSALAAYRVIVLS